MQYRMIDVVITLLSGVVAVRMLRIWLYGGGQRFQYLGATDDVVEPEHNFLQFRRKLLILALNAILGSEQTSGIRFGRTLTVTALLLLMTTSLIGLPTKTVLGLGEPPWQAFQNSVATIIKANETQLADRTVIKQQSPELQRAQRRQLVILRKLQRPVWGYLYSFVLALGVFLATWVSTFVSMVVTQHFLRRSDANQYSTGLAAEVVVLSALSFVMLVILLSALGILFNPVTWVALLLSRAIPLGYVVAIILGADLFALWLYGPWLKGVLLTSLLPMLILIVFGAISIGDFYRKRMAEASKGVLANVLTRDEPVVVPIAIVTLLLLFLYLAAKLVG